MPLASEDEAAEPVSLADALRASLAESLVTTRRSHLEPDRMAELAALNPGHDRKQLARLVVLADIHDEDDAATGYLEPRESGD